METKIQRALQVPFRGHTSFVITLRLSTVRNDEARLANFAGKPADGRLGKTPSKHQSVGARVSRSHVRL